MTMRLHWLLFGLLLAMCAVVGAAFVIASDPPAAAADGTTYPRAGYPHPEFPSMDAGGPGAARHEPVITVAWGFAMLQTAFLVGCLAFGVRRRERVGPIGWRLAGCGVGLAGILTVMVLTYANYMASPAPGLVLGMPVPTAWFLYVLWPFQLAFVLVFVLAFRAAVVDDGTLARFRAIVDARRAGREPPADG
ncbi:MAG: hypothetical protein OXH69_10960 [Acidobacteria bacterium]|nr:hypothetical protein [Acidobacteriota bacterium]